MLGCSSEQLCGDGIRATGFVREALQGFPELLESEWGQGGRLLFGLILEGQPGHGLVISGGFPEVVPVVHPVAHAVRHGDGSVGSLPGEFAGLEGSEEAFQALGFSLSDPLGIL